MVISNNFYPLNVLSTLGISRLKDFDGPKLPEQLANYLDQIIQGDDHKSLKELAPKVIEAAEEIAKTNPIVALNALNALMGSHDREMQNDYSQMQPGANQKAFDRINQYIVGQRDCYVKIASDAGISSSGLLITISDQNKFDNFMDNLKAHKDKISEDQKAFFYEFMSDLGMKIMTSIWDNDDSNAFGKHEKHLAHLEAIGINKVTKYHGDIPIDMANLKELVEGMKLGLAHNDQDAVNHMKEEIEKILQPLFTDPTN
jgi:hypothetical protein